MGRHDFFPQNTSYAHAKHGTPHIALVAMAIVMFAVIAVSYYVLVANGFAVLDEFNDAGTLGAFGFVGAYTFIVLAAPAFLKKRGELKAKHIVLCVVAMAPAAHSHRRQCLAGSGDVGKLLPVRVRRVSMVWRPSRHGYATSNAFSRERNQCRSPKNTCRRSQFHGCPAMA
jgi:hypothetical protein